MIDWSKVKTRQEKLAEEETERAERFRRGSIETERKAQGLREVTIGQAYTYIDNQLDSASNAAEMKEALRRILKRIIPYILD